MSDTTTIRVETDRITPSRVKKDRSLCARSVSRAITIGSLRETPRRPAGALLGTPKGSGTFAVAMGSACKLLLKSIGFPTLKDENPGKKFHFRNAAKVFFLLAFRLGGRESGLTIFSRLERIE